MTGKEIQDWLAKEYNEGKSLVRMALARALLKAFKKWRAGHKTHDNSFELIRAMQAHAARGLAAQARRPHRVGRPGTPLAIEQAPAREARAAASGAASPVADLPGTDDAHFWRARDEERAALNEAGRRAGAAAAIRRQTLDAATARRARKTAGGAALAERRAAAAARRHDTISHKIPAGPRVTNPAWRIKDTVQLGPTKEQEDLANDTP